MDPSIASMLALAMIGAVGIVAYEMKASLQRPVCAECPHCRALELAQQREQPISSSSTPNAGGWATATTTSEAGAADRAGRRADDRGLRRAAPNLPSRRSA